MTGYSRYQFGPAWTDDNSVFARRNGCDTRNDILRRDLTTSSAWGDCTVDSGVLDHPYTGQRIAFIRGVATSLALQIDRVVALGDAWQTGAQQLSGAQRVNLANDPLELIAVDGPTNQAKSDADAASWLPPQGVPVRLRGAAGRGQAEVWDTGHGGEARSGHRASRESASTRCLGEAALREAGLRELRS